MKKRIFSGIKPSGVIHLGNYFGSIYNWLPLMKDYECYFPIMDLHALTVYQEPKVLKENIITLAKLYLACGLKPQNALLFRQSDVPAHAELAWILNCLSLMSELERMTQYKDKAQQHKENINAGLFTYPCLMAADILLYNTDLVPVGEDQKQHVELARELARKFNRLYGQTFKVPEVLINKTAARLKGLDNPLKKMSKTASSEYNYISLLDSPDMIRRKIQKAVTDSGAEIKFTNDKPALGNLITLYHLATGLEIKEIEQKFKGKGYGDFKKALAEALIKFLQPIQKKFAALTHDQVEKVLQCGAKQARKLAEKNLQEIKRKVGL